MKMREKPIRGKKLPTKDGEIVTILQQTSKNMVRVLGESGLIREIPKNAIQFPEIDTSVYEKLEM